HDAGRSVQKVGGARAARPRRADEDVESVTEHGHDGDREAESIMRSTRGIGESPDQCAGGGIERVDRTRDVTQGLVPRCTDEDRVAGDGDGGAEFLEVRWYRVGILEDPCQGPEGWLRIRRGDA